MSAEILYTCKYVRIYLELREKNEERACDEGSPRERDHSVEISMASDK